MTRRLSLVMDEVIVTTERAATSCRSVLGTVCRPRIETKKTCGYFLYLYYTYNI